jgi:SAM-dependent methyltransferase
MKKTTNFLQRIIGEVLWLLGFTYVVHAENPWESENIVKKWVAKTTLEKPEETILNELRVELPKMMMLDIGVGGGRTTHDFAPLTREYVGVDNSEKMIRACRQEFRNYQKRITWEVADARNLPFEGSCFDFVLFSGCSIDLLNHDDRIRTLLEIQRVTKNGGYLCFSARNLNYAWKYTIFKARSRKPQDLLFEARRLFLTRLINRKVWKILRGNNQTRQGHLTFNDAVGAEHDFKLNIYYIAPKEQIDQLTNLNFKHIRTYNLLGNEIKNPSELRSAMDFSLYYLCNV